MQALILAFVFAQTAFADPIFDALLSIDKANQAAKRAGTPPCESCTVTLVGLDDPPWKQCLMELCPNGAGLYQSQIKAAGELALTDAKEKEILDLAMVSFRKELQNGLSAYEIASDALKENKPLTRIEAKVFVHATDTYEYMELLVKNDDGTIDIGASKQKAYDWSVSSGKPPIPDATLFSAISIYQKFMNAHDKVELLKEDYDFYVQKHGPEEIQSQVNEALDMLTSSSGKVATALSAPVETLFDTLHPEIVARLRNGNYSREDLEALKEETIGAIGLEGIMNDKLLLFKLIGKPVVPAEYLDKNTQALLPGFISSLKTYLGNSGEKPATVAGFEKDVIDACTNTLALAKLTLPTQAQIRDFPAKLDSYKSEFKTAMSKRMSAHSSGILSDAMAKWKFSIPPTYEQFQDSLKRKIEAEIRSQTSDAELLKSVNATSPDMSAAMAMSTAITSAKDLDWGDEIKELCQEAKVDPIRDAAYSSQDNLLVGSNVVAVPWTAATVTKHELGHKMSHLFKNGKMSQISKNWFDSVRTCLQKPYQGKDTYFEEDWGDLASAMAGGSGIACSFTNDNESSMTLVAPSGYTHSADLYRTLHQHMYVYGSIPKACADVLAAKGETFTLTNCDLPNTPAGK